MFNKQTVLIVDDNELNRDVLHHTILELNLIPHTVSSGYEAVDYLSNNKVDIVLLDIMMPGMTGYDVIKQIRKTNNMANIPVIAVTALATEINITGFNDLIKKPIIRSELVKVLSSLLPAKPEHTKEKHEVSSKEKKMNPKILIVDDMPINLKMQAMFFAENNYDVLIANTAIQGLLLAEEKQPDIILSDIMMPEVDGIEFCRRLKANPLTQKIPVCFLSADNTVETRKLAAEVGGLEYFLKPYNEKDILEKIKSHLPSK